jgi:hypothetical protein
MDNTVPLGKISDVILLFRTGLLLGSEAEQAPPLIQVNFQAVEINSFYFFEILYTSGP